MKGSKVEPLQHHRKALQLPVQFSLNPYIHYDGKSPTPHRDLLPSLGCGVSYLLLETFMSLSSLVLDSTGKQLGRTGFREFK